MKSCSLLFAALIASVVASAATNAPVAATSDFIAMAIADPNRPAADTERDANRKPAETLEFAGLRPGDRVAELLPGSGYFTRLFSKAVGANGRVYALVPAPAPDAPAGTVVEVLQPGYVLHDRLLRPAMVGVAKTPAKSSDGTDDAA